MRHFVGTDKILFINMSNYLTRKGKLYLVFEYLEKNLLEVLEQKPTGLDVIALRSLDKLNLV